MSISRTFEAALCPYCRQSVVASMPADRGWPRTASTICARCGRRFVVERLAPGQYRARKHRGLFEGLLRL